VNLTCLAMAPDEMTAEIWVARLQETGILAMVRPGDTISFLGVSLWPCRVLVAEECIEKAQEVLQHASKEGEQE